MVAVHQYHHWIDRADLLKSNARLLQLQLRQRFRIAVNRHRDGHFSSVIYRWIHRDRRRNSSSSSAFSRKRVVKDIYAEEESGITRMLQAVAVPVLGNVCHVFMHGLNRVQVYGAEKLHDVLRHKSKDKPLVTVSNHVASMDDPLVIASLLPPRVLMDAQNLRWTLCATDRCFKNPVTSAFFKSVKVLPVSRGDGIYQKGLDMAIAKLNSGGWVHIFPEGSRSRDGGRTVGSAKRGVGRLVVDADNVPIVVPFVHTGMQEIMPIGGSIPRIGKIVTVLVGDPIEFDDLVNEESSKFSSRANLYDAVSSRIGHRLQEMKVQVDSLAREQSRQMREVAVQSMDRATGILQQVDWESFGMKNYILSQDNNPVSPKDETNDEDSDLLNPMQKSSSAQSNNSTWLSNDGSIVSRIRSFLDDPSALMGFAAKGMFLNQQPKEVKVYSRGLNPWRVWKQYLEANGARSVQLC